MIPATLCALLAIGLAFKMPWSAQYGTFGDFVMATVMSCAAFTYIVWFLENWRASKEDL